MGPVDARPVGYGRRSQRDAAVGAETRGHDVHVAVGTDRLREAHVGRLFQQRVMEEITDIDEEGADDDGLKGQDKRRADRGLFQEQRAQ